MASLRTRDIARMLESVGGLLDLWGYRSSSRDDLSTVLREKADRRSDFERVMGDFERAANTVYAELSEDERAVVRGKLGEFGVARSDTGNQLTLF
ncbi:MAG: hypothetical protein AAGD00_09685 [Planctomycetota bacterium]